MKEMSSLDLITAIIAFLNIGVFGALVSRFTGANTSILILCSLLYIGGEPLETVGIMITYLVFMRLTTFTQSQRINFKNFRLFRGWRVGIPLALIVLSLPVYPFAALAIFLACFITEVLIRVYVQMPADKRMTPGEILPYTGGAAVLMVLGFWCTQFIPDQFYYGIAGTVILLLCALFWWLGQNRARLSGAWDAFIMSTFVLAGFFGFDLADWIEDMKRTTVKSRLSYNLPFVFLPAFFLTFIAANVLFGIFSFTGLILTFFSALSIRLFGYYQMSGRGKTNIVALAVTIFAAVCLFLTAPQPTGISHEIDLFLPSQPAVNLLDLIK